MRSRLPYMGSFQRGAHLRSSDPLEAVWRRIERIGTIDALSRIVQAQGHPTSASRAASLKIRQAIELRRASRDTSTLTRPLPLYYSMLNLTRGVMLAHQGTFGAASHGLAYKAGRTLLECKAEVSRRGTFRAFAEATGVPPAELDGAVYSLRDLFAVVPEVQTDFSLLKDGHSSIVTVRIESLIGGPTRLRYYVPDQDETQFSQNWTQMLPSMVDVCDLDGPFTLRLKVESLREPLVAEFCSLYLMHDLRLTDTALWFDCRVGGGVVLLERVLAYLAAMFILSNVSRYEPEFLDDATSQLTDLGYFLTSFLEAAERFFPQLVLELIQGEPIFFE